MCFNNVRSGKRLTNPGEKDVPLIDTKNAGFMGHKDTWQNLKEKEETNKDISSTELDQLRLGKRKFEQGHTTATDPKRKTERVH